MIDPKRALQIARDAFRGSTDYFNANIRPQIERDLRQFQSRHGPDSKYMSEAYKSRSRLYRPKTRVMVRKNEAVAAEAFFSTADLVVVQAENETDQMEQASAEIMKALLEYRLQRTVPWFQTLIGAYQDAMVQGVAIANPHWKYNPSRGIDGPDVPLIPVENLRYDPAADWRDPVNTSPYLIELMPMYVKDVKARMRPTAMAPAKWFPMDDNKILSAVKQYDSTRLLREDNRTSSVDKVTALTDFTIVWVHRNIVVDDDGSDVIYYTLGTEILLSNPEPLELAYAHGMRPYVIGSCIIETHKNYPSGKVRLARDTQTEINEVANQRIDNVKFAMNKRYFVKRNRQVDLRSLTRNVPGSVTLLTDIETDVKVLETPDVTSSAYQEQDRLNLDFDEIGGNLSQSSVQSNRRLNETVGGMELLNSDANQVQNYDLKVFVETFVEPLLNQIVLLEQYYETDDTVLAVAGQKAQLFQKFGISEISDDLLMRRLTMKVNVGTGSTSPATKINNLITGITGVKNALEDGVLERYGVKPAELIKEVFGAMGHKDGGRFLVQDGEEDPEVSSLKSQVQQLQQQLEAKHPQALIDAQVKEAEARASLITSQAAKADADKVKSGVESIYAAMQGAEVIASVPTVAPIADKLMQAAGYQNPNPAGVDPNFPIDAAQGEAAGLTANPVQNHRTGMQFTPGGNTDPVMPAHAPTAGIGERAGIETQRNDGVRSGGGGVA